MSLNNVRQYALMLVLLCGASGLPGMAKAAEEDCDMMSAVKKVDYGRYRKEDMRKASTEHVGKVYNGYASVTREFQVSVLCPDARKMRISVDGAARQNMAYRFTDSGAMKIEFRDGRVDGSPVQLAAVNGTEVVGEQFTATMMITTYLSDEAFGVTNTTDFNEMLTLNLDTLPAR